MQEKKDLNWQDKQKLQDVLDRQKQLQENIEKTPTAAPEPAGAAGVQAGR
jgi:hypothetical protein